MKPEIAKLWVDALRSGEFKQTTKCLEDKNGNCCLGVLCRIAINQGLNLKIKRLALTRFGEEMKSQVPPEEVTKWAGLHDDNPDVVNEGRQRSLAELNDNGRTFAEIADIIEANVDAL